MLSRLKCAFRLSSASFATFNARTRWPVKEAQYSGLITETLYQSQRPMEDTGKVWANMDNPTMLIAKNPYLEIFFNKTLQDISNRYQLLLGKNVRCNYGLNCYGMQVAETVSEDFSKEDPMELRKKCREFALEAVENYRKEYRKWGILCDSKSHYSTMDKEYEAAIADGFSRLWKKRLVFRSQRPVFWSTSRHIALEETEMEERKETRDCLFVPFDISTNSKTGLKYPNTKLLTYVKEPWKLVGVNGLVINQNISYQLIKFRGEQYILSKSRVREMIARFGTGEVKVNKTVPIEDLLKITVTEPLCGKPCRLYDYEAVNDTYGSGIDPVCPAHDFESVIISARYGLPTIGFLDKNGLIESSLGEPYAGTSCVTEAGNQVVKDVLAKANRVLWEGKGQNIYSIEKSTGQRVILRTIPAWFLKIPKSAKSKMLRELVFTRYVPKLEIIEYNEFMKKAEKDHKEKQHKSKKSKEELKLHHKAFYIPFLKFLHSMNDMCISEENHWSIPIPCFRNIHTGELLTNDRIISHVAKKYRASGTDCWYYASVKELLPDEYKEIAPELEKVYESFDPLFIGAMSPCYLSTEKDVKNTNIATECHTQHDPWVSKAVVMSSILNGKLPFHLLKTYGRIVDDLGEALNRLVYPIDIIDGSVKIAGERKYGLGADVLRAWAAINDTDSNVSLQERHLDNINRLVKNIRMVVEKAFLILKENDSVSSEELTILDDYILYKLSGFLINLKESYENYTYGTILETVSKFMTTVFAEYLKVNTSQEGSKAGTNYAIIKVLDSLSKVVHPILPYFSAEMLECLNGKVDEKQLKWPDMDQVEIQTSTFDLVEGLFKLRKEVLEGLEELKEKKRIPDENSVELVIAYKAPEEIEDIGCNLMAFFGVGAINLTENMEISKDVHLKTIKFSRRGIRAHLRKIPKGVQGNVMSTAI